MQALYELKQTFSKVKAPHVFDMNRVAWQATANPGLALKPVRHDDAKGLFLGLVKFEAFSRSGIHQHQGVATSFVVDGGLTDYHGAIALHEAGINLKGATHDAIAYQNTLLVSRLEAPVSYPLQSDISGVHAGSHRQNFENPNPNVPPEINVAVDGLLARATGYAGIKTQRIFDYAGTGTNHRYLQCSIAPKTQCLFRTTALTEFWVRGGNLTINGQEAFANCFIVCEPGTQVSIDSPYGALLLAWAQGPEEGWSTHPEHQRNLFAF